MKKGKYRTDIIAIAAVLLIGAVIFLVLMLTQKSGNTVVVKVDGKTVKEFSLDTDTEYEIEGINDGHNLLVIKDGKAKVTEASCPDGLCIGMGEIEKTGQSIVCLPNKVVVEVEGDGSDSEVDITVG